MTSTRARGELGVGGSHDALYPVARRKSKRFLSGHIVTVANAGGGPGAGVCFDDGKRYRANAARRSRSSDAGKAKPARRWRGEAATTESAGAGKAKPLV